MKKSTTFSLLFFVLFFQLQNIVALKTVKLTCENLQNPIGIDNFQPGLSWQIISDSRSVFQSAYRIIVADNLKDISANKGNVWDSRMIKSSQSILVIYNGLSLKSTKTYFWKVQIWDERNRKSAWSEIANWQMGLLEPADWLNARWIGYEDQPDSMLTGPAADNELNYGFKARKRTVIPLFRKEFKVTKKVLNGTLSISGLGQYEARINGKKIGNSFLSPGWTNSDKTIYYNSYNVTNDLRQGMNAIGVIVGNGFYNINRERYRKFAVNLGLPKLICRLKITYNDNSEENVVSSLDWKSTPSAITFSSIYGGEDYDARLEPLKWDESGYTDSSWKSVVLPKMPNGSLKAETDYPVSVMEKISTKSILKIDSSKYLYDFGQNASGIIELKVIGKKGQQVKIYPGEFLDEKNNINQSASGSPYYLTYTLKGDGVEIWQPKFTYYGFRYAIVDGACPDSTRILSEMPRVISLNSNHTRNSSPQNGDFSCSSELFNKIFNLINWAIKSNLQSVLTDCPHREKLGWLEESYLMGNSINYNFNIYHLYCKMVNDMSDSQLKNGLVPDIAPEYVKFDSGFRDSPEWGSASVILPWIIYKLYGDKALLEKAWPMMTRYVEYLGKKANNNILSYGLGDWYDLGPKNPGEAQLTPKSLTATSVYFYDLKLLGQIASIIQKNKEAKYYTDWSDKIKSAFNETFFNPTTKVYSTGSQTAISMPLSLGLVEDKYRKQVVENLVDSIIDNNKALTAGDIGFHFLVEALVKNDNSQLLFEMNNREDVPGYGFQLKHGATSLTESWMANKISSNNHLMLGHLMQWFYESLGGIQQIENSIAFKNLLIKPTIVGDLTFATANFETPYGTVKTSWSKKVNSFSLKVTIPENTSGLVYLPVTGNSIVFESNIAVEKSKDIRFIEKLNDYLVYKVGSGTYNFEIK
jgi:alpha-L-rhamnosidase